MQCIRSEVDEDGLDADEQARHKDEVEGRLQEEKEDTERRVAKFKDRIKYCEEKMAQLEAKAAAAQDAGDAKTAGRYREGAEKLGKRLKKLTVDLSVWGKSSSQVRSTRGMATAQEVQSLVGGDDMTVVVPEAVPPAPTDPGTDRAQRVHATAALARLSSAPIIASAPVPVPGPGPPQLGGDIDVEALVRAVGEHGRGMAARVERVVPVPVVEASFVRQVSIVARELRPTVHSTGPPDRRGVPYFTCHSPIHSEDVAKFCMCLCGIIGYLVVATVACIVIFGAGLIALYLVYTSSTPGRADGKNQRIIIFGAGLFGAGLICAGLIARYEQSLRRYVRPERVVPVPVVDLGPRTYREYREYRDWDISE